MYDLINIEFYKYMLVLTAAKLGMHFRQVGTGAMNDGKVVGHKNLSQMNLCLTQMFQHDRKLL